MLEKNKEILCQYRDSEENLVILIMFKILLIYQQPIDRLACLQSDFVNMASSIKPTRIEDYITRRWLLKMSNA